MGKRMLRQVRGLEAHVANPASRTLSHEDMADRMLAHDPWFRHFVQARFASAGVPLSRQAYQNVRVRLKERLVGLLQQGYAFGAFANYATSHRGNLVRSELRQRS